MLRENAADLLAFLAVAKERSFTKAAARLGVSQSALSHTVRSLEARLGLRLLTRTTRSVSPTEAGERLIQKVGPHFDEIEIELAGLSDLRDTPAGKIRINAMDHSLDLIIRPVLKTFLHKYPDISVEVCCDYSFVDIAAEGFDAGVRLGEAVADGMIATRIGPDMRLSVVGSPAYFEGRTKPETPRDLTAHRCNNLRLPTNGGLYAWEFAKDSETLNVRVTGQVTFNGVYPLLDAALDGFGLSYIPHDLVAEHIEAGRLIQVLEDWSPTFAGFHLYYPSRRQASPAFALLLEALRYR
ncbi:LysR family transcriptional regulator [Pseudomonas syringae]|nr:MULTISPECIES: LysR family transcriptional regulator [Pseudomonas]MCW6055102.1 LysR family transcriptional regulator [Pseudomonas fragi]EGH71243.1 transcriptional regulator, lysr family protein [Pseudomonas syringae pv. aceris str. M302273]KOG02502.1 Transcriptional regulator, lysr family protein [Pseudomonas syringae pv. aceris]KPW23034.1 Transcriptional regulator, lysr family protein [Pseudomonas syringae pv. aceris]KPY52271.1 Transcriptional regulator, lysr family protein [Pseudomonas syr